MTTYASTASGRGLLARLDQRFAPKLFLSELLSKRWMEPVIPFLVMIGLMIFFGATLPNYLTSYNVQNLLGEFTMPALVAMAMGITIISGGIDLSVGSTFALANFVALASLHVLGLPVPLAIAAAMGTGVLIGAINGFLIGYLNARPLLTTLVSLIVIRAVFDMLSQKYAVRLASGYVESDLWDFIADGYLAGLPANTFILLGVVLVAHVLLSRTRPGWHVYAVGSSRKAARHAGIDVRLVLFSSYVVSGLLCGLAGVLYAARQASSGSDTGAGWEVSALTAVVLGGISLAGGRGTMPRALIGAAIVFLLINGFVRTGLPGNITQAALGFVLLVAVCIDVKWAKNRGKFLQKIYLNPTVVDLGECPSTQRGSDSPFAENDRLKDAEAIGLDMVEGPEDIILDRQGRLYGGTREGWIIRFSGENFEKREVFARIGGRPLGLAFDRDDNLIVCVGGMGLYAVAPDGTVRMLTVQTNRTPFKLNDDSRLRLADDLDIAPDGKIYFSEATIRYEMHSWFLDGVEGRPNGRLVCYDPATGTTRTLLKNVVFPNGVCVAHDGRSVLFASTWLCKIFRYWIEGPQKGEVEVFAENLPGYPDNINRASDGGYWLAMVGMRSPVYDLAMRKPGFRLRMIKQIPSDEWVYPGINNGCVIKFDPGGKPLESYWDPGGQSHPTITSVREDRGFLYIGGLENNRIGRIRLEGADPEWTSQGAYWDGYGKGRERS